MHTIQRSHRHSLAALFDPRSVAIIGASDDPTKIGGRPIQLLKAARFASPIYPVNPARRIVQGLPAFTSIAEVPDHPELVIIAVPAPQVPSMFEEAVAAGAKAAIVYTSGFAEAGKTGSDAQGRLIDRARSSGCRLLGPNCLGVINTRSGLLATFSGGIGERLPEPGSIGLASQSGALGAHCLVLAERRGLAFSHWATSGNEGDVDVAELVAYMAVDPDTRVIVACIEGIRSAERLADALALARERGKHVVLMKVGSSSVGAAAAASHTASMVGSDKVFDAVVREFGVFRAGSIDEMFDVVYGLSMHAPPRNDQMAIVTTSGGVGVLIADEAERLGIAIPELSEATQARIRELLPYAGTRNPIDITAQITNQPELLDSIFDILLRSATCGSLVVFLSHLGLRPDMMSKLLPAFGHVARSRPDAVRVACLLSDSNTRTELETLGFSVFEDPTRAIRTVGALVAIARAGEAVTDRAGEALATADSVHLTPGKDYNEIEAKGVMGSMGIRILPDLLARNCDEAVELARSIGYPVALKVVSRDIQHKSDVGGVLLSLDGPEAVREAYVSILRRVGTASPQAIIEGVMVSPMAPAGVDVIVGALMDGTFGPCVVVGMGGVFAELLDDTVVARAPVSRSKARAMIDRLRGAKILLGARGTQPCDVDALAESISRLSAYAHANREVMGTLEINPLRVLSQGKGVVALDALVTVRELATP